MVFFIGNGVANGGPTNSASGSGPTKTGDGGGGSNSTGAIAGGVVGGVAGLALIGAGVGYLIYRKRKQRVGAMPEVSQYSSTY